MSQLKQNINFDVIKFETEMAQPWPLQLDHCNLPLRLLKPMEVNLGNFGLGLRWNYWNSTDVRAIDCEMEKTILTLVSKVSGFTQK